jgi:hypothetical protein
MTRKDLIGRVLDLYRDGMKPAQIAREVGTDPDDVRGIIKGRTSVAGVPTKKKEPRWTAEEVAVIERAMIARPDIPYAEIAPLLPNRTMGAVVTKAGDVKAALRATGRLPNPRAMPAPAPVKEPPPVPPGCIRNGRGVTLPRVDLGRIEAMLARLDARIREAA